MRISHLFIALVLSFSLVSGRATMAHADNPLKDTAKALCWACWLTGGLANPKVCWDPETGRTCRRIVFGNQMSQGAQTFEEQMSSGTDLSVGTEDELLDAAAQLSE